MSMTAEEAEKKSKKVRMEKNKSLDLSFINEIDEMIKRAVENGDYKISYDTASLSPDEDEYLIDYYRDLGYKIHLSYGTTIFIIWGSRKKDV